MHPRSCLAALAALAALAGGCGPAGPTDVPPGRGWYCYGPDAPVGLQDSCWREPNAVGTPVHEDTAWCYSFGRAPQTPDCSQTQDTCEAARAELRAAGYAVSDCAAEP